MNTRIGRIARRQAHICNYGPSPSPSPKASPDDEVNNDKDDADFSDDDDLSVTCPLSFVTKRRSSFGFESSLMLRGRISIGYF